MKQYNLGFLGFGNVGKALARLLVTKSAELRDTYGIEWRITGVATRSLGWLASPAGLEIPVLTSSPGSDQVSRCSGISDWLSKALPDVVFETTSLNHVTGQPAIDYLKAVLTSGAHAITANKGAVVYGYDELNELAKRAGKRFFFESTVLDSAPVFSLFRETLPAAKLRGFSGLFSSTTNVILETMEAGRSFDEGVKSAQELGITETDPSHDVEGWDATVKVCALATVLMKVALKPDRVKREGIRHLTTQVLQTARAEGKPFKLAARAKIAEDGSINATVRPEQIAAGDPLGNVRGTSLAVHFELDMMPGANDHLASTESSEHSVWFVGGFYQCSQRVSFEFGTLSADYADYADYKNMKT